MQLLNALLASLGAFALLHLVLIPMADRRSAKGDPDKVISNAALDAVLGYLKQLSLVIALAMAVVMVMVAGASSGLSSEQEWGRAIQSARDLKDQIGIIGGGWSAFAIVGLIAALGISAYRQGRLFGETKLNQAYERALIDLARKQQEEGLEDLPPTSEMNVVSRQAEKILSALRKESDPSVREHLEQVLEQAKEMMQGLDVRRRLQFRFEPETPSSDRDLKTRVQIFFSSKGWLGCIGKGGKAISYAGLAALMISLLSFNSGAVEEGLSERIVQLEDLRISAERKDLQSEFERVVLPSGESAALDSTPVSDEEEAVTIDLLARAFEDSLLDLPEFRPTTKSIRVAAKAVRSQLARSAILDAAQAVAPSSNSLSFDSAGVKANGLGDMERLGLSLVEQGQNAIGPRTKIGKAFAARLRAEKAMVGSNAWQNLVGKLSAARGSFSSPMDTAEIGRMLTGEIFGTAVDGVLPSTDNVLANSVRAAASKAGTASCEELFAVKYQQFLVDICEASNLTDGLANFGSRTGAPVAKDVQRAISNIASELPDFEHTIELLRNHPPSVSTPPSSAANLKKSMSWVDGTRNLFPQGALSPEMFTDTLLSYDDLAPRRLGVEVGTNLGQALAKYDPTWFGKGATNAGPTGLKLTGKAAARSLSNFARGGNFRAMRGFWRVGGVVIGQEPEGGTELDFVGLDWVEAGDSEISLILTPAAGEPITLGPYDKQTVHRALIYAADGRPLAVTMTTAPPLADLKIHVHSALIDTALGRSAVELDRFVDKFSPDGPKTKRKNRMEQIGCELAFYELARTSRILSLFAKAESGFLKKLFAGSQGAANAVVAQAGQLGGLVTVEDLDLDVLRGILLDEVTKSNPSSLLLLKPEYFDRALVDALIELLEADSDITLDELTSRLCTRRWPTLKNKRFRADDDFRRFVVSERGKRILADSPSTETWSGVREAAFELSADLSFLQWDGNLDEADPLEFMIQVAFVTPPSFLPLGGPDPEAYIDPCPFEFTELEGGIWRSIVEGTEGRNADRQVLNHMIEFALLQRLFRTTLGGGFGDGFPMEKLAELTTTTGSPPSPEKVTPRWHARPGFLEARVVGQLRALRLAVLLEQGGDRVLSELSAYTTKVQSNLPATTVGDTDMSKLRTLSTEDWVSAFLSRPGGPAETLLKKLQDSDKSELHQQLRAFLLTVRARSLRDTLEVDKNS